MVNKKNKKLQFEDSALLDPSAKSFIYDEVDNFNDDDNADEQLYNNLSSKKEKSKEQVLGIGGYSSDESLSSIEDSDEDDGEFFENDIQSPVESASEEEDTRTFGKRKKDYFGTDLTDKRLHNAAKNIGRKKGDDEALERELEGVQDLRGDNRLQGVFNRRSRRESRLEGEDALSLTNQISGIELDTDNSNLKFKALEAERNAELTMEAFPEYMQEIMEELSSKLSPLMEAKKKGLLPMSPAVEYLQTRYFLCLNYVNTFTAFMMVKSSGVDMADHPAQTRVTQYKTLLKEFEVCKDKFDPELAKLKSDLASGKLKVQRKMLNLLSKKKRKIDDVVDEEDENEEVEGEKNNEMSDEEEEDGQERSSYPAEMKEDERRVISYQMTKNKGLVPSRKKEQRNPRVKYKKKYQNKLKRRKGQVREVRKELDRYSGEISGIKANLVRSIKIK